MTPEAARRRPVEQLPDWFPGWAAQLADLYFPARPSVLVLHGNTNDLFRVVGDGGPRAGSHGVLAGRCRRGWSLVLHYDLGRGLRAFGGRDEKRLKEMVALANRKVGDLSDSQIRPRPLPCSIGSSANIMADEDDRLSAAGDHRPGLALSSGDRAPEPHVLVAAGDDAELGDEPAHQAPQHGVHPRRQKLADVSERLQEIRTSRRLGSLPVSRSAKRSSPRPPPEPLKDFSDFDGPQLAGLTRPALR
jgi:hypothetical protein